MATAARQERRPMLQSLKGRLSVKMAALNLTLK
jgi:hypothetical protein